MFRIRHRHSEQHFELRTVIYYVSYVHSASECLKDWQSLLCDLLAGKTSKGTYTFGVRIYMLYVCTRRTAEASTLNAAA